MTHDKLFAFKSAVADDAVAVVSVKTDPTPSSLKVFEPIRFHLAPIGRNDICDRVRFFLSLSLFIRDLSLPIHHHIGHVGWGFHFGSGSPPPPLSLLPGRAMSQTEREQKKRKKKEERGGGGEGACRFGSAGECHGGSGKCNKLFRRRATSLALLAHYAFACTLLLFTRYHNMAAQHGGLGSSRLCHSIVFSVFGAGDEERGGGGLEGIFFSAAVVVLVRLLVASRSCLLAYANIHQRQRHSYCTGRSVLFKFKCSLFSPTI